MPQIAHLNLMPSKNSVCASMDDLKRVIKVIDLLSEGGRVVEGGRSGFFLGMGV